MAKKNVLISIRPKYAKLIFTGQKTIELRRVMPNVNEGDLIVVYVSSPVKQVWGTFEVSAIIEEPIDVLWQKVKNQAGISYTEYIDYFSGVDHGFGLVIQKAKVKANPISLSDLRMQWSGFIPPQSYRYLSNAEMNYFV